ncbi:YbjN domain-containing protein [Caulobacter sp. NIBR1757]|uniref:YbjN domain-containing protein n=1 Tax=Caulobacter sp. NIBR1757 TaxID=3016000 RepID=UPI0022F0D435|nr:YbjN domain-containing protein [Caulobacter sp. NIBR1757]WGM40846.1 hypothetical protein AMEJIAPC_03793 [Caulobacter sp. NIBR1757]
MAWRALAMTAVVLAATPAMAAELPRTGRAEVYYSVTAEQVASVLRKAGFKTKVVADAHKDGEKPSWTIQAEDNTPFYMGVDVRACDAEGHPKGCLGLRFFASMDLETSDLAVARRTADRYNRDYYIGKAYVSDDGKSLYFENYLMVDGGVTMDHLEKNLSNFLSGYDSLVDLYEVQDAAVDA